MHAVELLPLEEQLQHDGRAAGRQQEPPEEPLPPGILEQGGQAHRHQDGQHHLAAAGAQHHLAHAVELVQGEFDPDGEQQQDDPDLGHQFDGFAIGDQSQPGGADQQPGQQVGHDGRLAGPLQHHRDHGGEAEKHQQVAQQLVVCFHQGTEVA